MRLIDADDLRRVFDECVWNDAVSEVDGMPTAFDLTKVTEEIKHLRIKEVSVNGKIVPMVRIMDVLDILNGGGVK